MVIAVTTWLIAIVGCGKKESLDLVDPDYDDPAWYDDYKNDKRNAYDKYDDTIVQIRVLVGDREETAGGTEITGTTGDQNLYRASCKFSTAAREGLEGVKVGSFIRIKGYFDHMQETSNSYQIYLRNCVVVR